jgi:ABC-2 type transport system ATP-binding protein
MIEVQSLTKQYNERLAVNGVSFSVPRGQILGFLGPNGAGKSTTMKILSGFIPATSGRASINGFDVQKQSLQAKASIGYLPETPPVYMDMTVEDYLQYAAAIHGLAKNKIKPAVGEAMEKCGISDVRSRLIGNLSKGYRQRVGLAQAIAHKPPVLILDEPTVGLDPKQIIDIRNLIKSLGGDHTVILSTHILPEVQATCDHVVVIDKGRVVASDTLDGIAARMQGNLRISIQTKRSPKQVFEKIRALSGVLRLEEQGSAGEGFGFIVECAKDSDQRSAMAQICVDSNLDLLALSLDKISLEDAFVRLVTQEVRG